MYYNTTEAFREKMNSWMKDRAYKENLQLMKLLIQAPWFQEIVSAARKRLNINQASFTTQKADGAYLLSGEKYQDEFDWPQKITGRYSFFLNEVFIVRKALPFHFEKAVIDYIIQNKITAPILDFIITYGCTGCEKHPPTLPQIFKFKELDSKQEKIAKEMYDYLVRPKNRKKPFPSLFSKKFRPNDSLAEKIKFLDLVNAKKSDLEKEYSDHKFTDEDVATHFSKKPTPKEVNKVVKKIRNTRVQIQNALQKRDVDWY